MEALAVVDSGSEVALMLCDVLMADLDGFCLLERVKDKYPDISVVMATEVHHVGVVLSAFRWGASDYLLKPFDQEHLLSTVRRALEHRRLKLENRDYQKNLESQVAARTEQLEALERSYDLTLESLGDALRLKDAETEGHSKPVTAFTIGIARAIGVPKDGISVIARGAFLHDIGKIATPEAILRKPGALTKDGIAVMRQHCFRGYEIVKQIPFLAEPAEIVYSHQERYDGTGYPRGLKGEQIPFGARIVAVANTLDAITSDRPYRAAQSVGAASAEIHRWSGRQFDPEIVRTFLSMSENTWSDLRKEIEAQIERFASS
jgi:putative nucleotidyltransferase with HDIG domain